MVENDQNALVFEKLRAMARGHVAQQTDMLSLLQFNPNQELHDLTKVSFGPLSTSFEAVVALARAITPEREELFQKKLREKPGLLPKLYEALAKRKTVCVLMAHDDITDIAKVEGEIIIALCEYHADQTAERGTYSWNAACREYYVGSVNRFHVILSSIVRSIAAVGQPAGNVLRQIGWVHFSFPQTESMRTAEFDKELIKSSNKLMLNNLDNELSKNGGILTVAGPGSVDKVIEQNGIKVRHIQPVRLGTYQIISDMLVLPVAARLIGKGKFFELGRLAKPSNMQEVHQMMVWIASASYAHTGQPTYYHESNNEMKDFIASYNTAP
jgi:hypothetical protein